MPCFLFVCFLFFTVEQSKILSSYEIGKCHFNNLAFYFVFASFETEFLYVDLAVLELTL